jgi:hypothetical protein
MPAQTTIRAEGNIFHQVAVLADRSVFPFILFAFCLRYTGNGLLLLHGHISWASASCEALIFEDEQDIVYCSFWIARIERVNRCKIMLHDILTNDPLIQMTMFNNGYNNITTWRPNTGEIVGLAIGGAAIVFAILICCISCCRRRNNRRLGNRLAGVMRPNPPKFYPEASYLYDPPPGASTVPGHGQPLMAAQREIPDTGYMGAAGAAPVGPLPENAGLLGNVPSARSVLAPLSGYSRAGQQEDTLNPFGDHAQYRDSLDHRQ